MILPPIRILLADNFRDWRQVFRSILLARKEYQIIYEASDGSEAIQKTEELKPDLVLLEAGLPKPNGIEVARRIYQRSPNSRIIFMSLENSLEVLEVALSTCAGTDLLLAIQAVLRGKNLSVAA